METKQILVRNIDANFFFMMQARDYAKQFPDRMNRLMEDIREHGLLQPIGVIPMAENRHYLVFGYKRLMCYLRIHDIRVFRDLKIEASICSCRVSDVYELRKTTLLKYKDGSA